MMREDMFGTFKIDILTCSILLLLAGCAAVGPQYVKTDPSVNPAWNAQLADGLEDRQIDSQELAQWWTMLDDPVLIGLVESAIESNLDLKEARVRLNEARSRRSIAGADRFPTLGARASAGKSRSSEDSGSGLERESYDTGFDAAWELDLFGGVRRALEAAQADYEATREDLNDVLVSLSAEVALNYVEVRTFQERIAVSDTNLAILMETYELVQARAQAGLDDELAVFQAKASLESARAQIPSLRTGLEEGMNRLALLLGEQPGALHAELEKARPIPVTPLEVAVGVPADILRRRPDVRSTERELAAQTARIGVATADLYPKITFSGSIGLDALSLDNLFTAGSRTWSYGPGISWQVFNASAIRANIEVQSALQEQALIRYEAAVLAALEEVENALVDYAHEQQRREALIQAVDAARQAFELAEYKYRTGLTDFITMLDSQRTLLSHQDQLAQSNGSVTTNLIRLYKALGGGWIPMVPGISDKSAS